MKKRFIIAMLLSCVLFTGCSHNDTDVIQTTDEDVIDLSQSEDITTSFEVDEIISVGDSGYKFSSDDSRITNAAKILDVASSSSNIVISPLSLDLMLGAAADYGNDSVQESFTNYFGSDVAAFKEFVDDYMSSICDTDNISIVNRVFIDDSVIENVPDNHRDVISLDLDSPDAPSVINQIFRDKTNGAIQDVIFDTAGYESIFINTLYFKDDWDEPVAIVHEDEVFSRFDGTEELVTMLDFTSDIYFENENAVGFAKLYENDRYGFIGILPNTEGEFQLIDMDLDSFLASKTEADVKVLMPEFSLKNNMNLTSVLDSLGLDIFESGMFDRLIENQAFTLSSIMHSVKIDVNRDGTEASAVTSGFMVGTSMPEENPDEKIVCLNRPFAFVIYDFENDVPMFIGKVVSVN